MVVDVFDLSIIGRRKTICQDSTLSFSDGDLFVLAVADGLGSHRHSHLGSQKIIEFTKSNLIRLSQLKLIDSVKTQANYLNDFFASLIQDWKTWAGRVGLDVDTTYSLFVGYKDYYFLRSVGDSILLFSDEETFDVIVSTETVRTASGATPSLMSCDRKDYYRANFFRKGLCKVVLSTDGLEDIIISERDEERARRVHDWFIQLLEGSLGRQPEQLSKIITEEFISKWGETKGDDVGLSYAIFRKS